ncbi:S8 family serine peptidase [Bacillus atrophaeus]|uniref:S8 family peptidase n=1 Tax=Bacillus atrophaeus TaxID=1452 RepID=UPI00227E1F3D|nr:S8 family serine peptidase [Bacillus atrophaeus]MCY8908563.1 S8 family serine peptidase [Bacillus atrophaeus]MCY8920948.1 S8 family serine peptidase [Bacillus atrophaeus]MEC0836790.1 S8 family serine peptidase [Bacillus atrophaeus]MEC0844575.1 S8 family serine peptidase [Bacillus atrophaeus]MEC0849083.1 S8 family serine peptidase [Bacillus atrophaeus]
MKNGMIRFLLLSFVLFFTLSTSITGVQAVPATKEKAPDLEKAEVFGDIDMTTKKQTTVIVELKEKSLAEAKDAGESQSKNKLKNARSKAKSKVAKAVKNGKVHREYEQVFSGFSMKLPANEIPKLLAVEDVKAVYPNVTYTTDHLKKKDITIAQDAISPQMDESAPYIGANDAWDLGYTGKGMKVAVIDTGVEYNHPDLKKNFGPYKGYDFVDNDYTPKETPVGDPRGEATDHGTHVAGTVAANGTIKGVAPDATLLAYRVLGPGGSGTTENVIAGVERAVQDGADVMNLSLGDTVNSPDWATSTALDWAMSEGVVAVTSNGNSGPNGWTVGSPGTSREAISVGATQLPLNEYAVTFGSFASAKVLGYDKENDMKALNHKELELVEAGLGEAKDFEGKDLTGKIAVVKRGNIAFVEKADNAKKAGAIGMIVYNNYAGEIEANVPGMSVPTMKLSLEDGETLVKNIQKGDTKATFELTVSKALGEQVADFSSRGPVMDTWMIKPDISAPGVNIVSTIPTHDSDNPYGYGSKQGTSMASPHIAGAVAVIKQAKPKWSVEQIKSAIMNTAVTLKDGDGKVYPHNTQGAGSARIINTLKADSIVSPGSYSYGTFLKEKGKETKKETFTIENQSSIRKSYQLEYSFNGNGITTSGTSRVVIPARQTGKAVAKVNVDTKKAKAGTYEGTVTVREGGKTVAKIPTLLIVKEPDYPRVTSIDVSEGSVQGTYEIETYLPAGAEELAFLVYDQNFEFMGQAGIYKNQDKGYQYFDWDGKINGESKLPAGEYYMLAYAANKGKSSQVLTQKPFTVE